MFIKLYVNILLVIWYFTASWSTQYILVQNSMLEVFFIINYCVSPYGSINWVLQPMIEQIWSLLHITTHNTFEDSYNSNPLTYHTHSVAIPWDMTDNFLCSFTPTTFHLKLKTILYFFWIYHMLSKEIIYSTKPYYLMDIHQYP